MPTPFTHLVHAQRLIDDPKLSSSQRAFLTHYWGAFLLGNIAPDAHHKTSTLKREATHFFAYSARIEPLAEDAMLAAYPELTFRKLGESAHAAFIAGYLAHLAVDEVWCEQVMIPFVSAKDWGNKYERHFMFVTLMCIIDGRDFENIPATHHPALAAAEAEDWLPFMSDEAINAWRDMVAEQIRPGGVRETLDIMGRVVAGGRNGLVSILNSPERLQRELWDRFSSERVHQATEASYQHMCRVVCTYSGR